MTDHTGSRYIFSGSSNSIGAVFQEPFKDFLSNGPSAALPVTGGYNFQKHENINFREIVRVGRATAAVLGEKRGDQYVTLATSTIERLNILDVITADAIVGRVTSVYPAGNYRDLKIDPAAQHPSKFYFAGSHFDNLRIAGEVVNIAVDGEVSHGDALQVMQGEISRRLAFSGFTKSRDPVHIPQFGDIYLGEIDVFCSRVTLTMLRVELGSPHVGRIAAATNSTNGHDGY